MLLRCLNSAASSFTVSRAQSSHLSCEALWGQLLTPSFYSSHLPHWGHTSLSPLWPSFSSSDVQAASSSEPLLWLLPHSRAPSPWSQGSPDVSVLTPLSWRGLAQLLAPCVTLPRHAPDTFSGPCLCPRCGQCPHAQRPEKGTEDVAEDTSGRKWSPVWWVMKGFPGRVGSFRLGPEARWAGEQAHQLSITGLGRGSPDCSRLRHVCFPPAPSSLPDRTLVLVCFFLVSR